MEDLTDKQMRDIVDLMSKTLMQDWDLALKMAIKEVLK